MKHQTLTVLFYLNKAKTNQKGLCPIYCRITFHQIRKQFSTGQFVNLKNWNAKKQKVESKDSNAEFINAQLLLILQKLNSAYLSLQLKGQEFSVSDILDNYAGRKIKKEENVISYFKSYLSKLKKLVGKDIKQSTYNKFEYVCNDIEGFIRYKYKSSDVLLSSLNLQFLLDFEYYLKTVKNQKQVTINKEIQRFRRIVNSAMTEGFLEFDPFASFKTKTVKPIVVFLDTDELKKLEEKQFTHPKLILVKDLFIFSCYTGLAYYELTRLENKHIVKGFDGKLWIKMTREKTSKPFSVPLLPKALDLIGHYQNNDERIFPNISNQRYNTYLKEIAALTNIEKNLTTHTARKTFASTVLLFNDVPMEIVSELLGHSNMKVTQESYGKVVQRKIGDEMNRLRKKLTGD